MVTSLDTSDSGLAFLLFSKWNFIVVKRKNQRHRTYALIIVVLNFCEISVSISIPMYIDISISISSQLHFNQT